MNVYWLTRLSSLETACEFGVVFTVVYAILCGIMCLLDADDFTNTFRPLKYMVCRFFPLDMILFALFVVGCVMLPTKKDVYLMLGTGYADRIVGEMAE